MIEFTATDLDGTLRETMSGAKLINEPTDQKPIDGASEALNRVSGDVIGCANQLGIKKGFKSFKNAIAEQGETLELFPKLSAILLCPDEGYTCWCVMRDKFWEISEGYPQFKGQFRKPGAGMLLVAMNLVDAHPENSQFIGDRPEDELAAINARMHFQWAHQFRARKT